MLSPSSSQVYCVVSTSFHENATVIEKSNAGIQRLLASRDTEGRL